MHTHDFRFLGFLPIKKGRHTLFESLRSKDYTAICYESVHRIERTLSDISEVFGPDHKIVVAREITKKFEEFVRMSVSEAQEYFKKNPMKGEFVVIF